MKKLLVKILVVAVSFGVFVGAQAGCYGKFLLTSKIYRWNGKVSANKWVKTIVMWVMIILPVYGLAVFIDFICLNVLEFWTGSNPIAFRNADGDIEIAEGDNKAVIHETKTSLVIEFYENEALIGQADVIKGSSEARLSMVGQEPIMVSAARVGDYIRVSEKTASGEVSLEEVTYTDALDRFDKLSLPVPTD